MSNPATSNAPTSTAVPLNFAAVLRQMLKVSDKVSDLIFSPGRQPQIELASKLQAVQVPGLEMLTHAHTASIAMRTREYIEKGESEGKSLLDAMEQGDQDGMQTFDDVLEKMIRSGVLTQEAAMSFATNAGNLLLRLGDLGGHAPLPKASASSRDENSMLDMIEK